MTRLLPPLALVLLASASSAQDWVVPAGTVQVFDTLAGRVTVDRLVVEPGAVLRVQGPFPFGVVARREIRLEGRIDLSGVDSPGVLTLGTANQPELGAAGQAAGGRGGTGSPLTTQSTPRGGPGFGPYQVPAGGGQGGETGYGLAGVDGRRGAGGGGGRLGPDRPVHPDPDHPSNEGRIAEPGRDGTPTGLGAESQSAPPRGGAPGTGVFLDGSPDNDFWGVRLDPVLGPVAGELAAPVPGAGGGAGGDAVQSASFPLVPFLPSGDEKGAGGGGGGGLGVLVTRRLVMGPGGAVVADGGSGGGGENSSFLNRVGGGSGGGSGGYLVLQANLFDLSQASPGCLSALGGPGGPGRNDQPDTVGAGGNGGPGVIQLHTPDGGPGALLLPPASTLADLARPEPVVLLPVY